MHNTCRQIASAGLATLVVVLSGCAGLGPSGTSSTVPRSAQPPEDRPHLVALTTQMTGYNQVPPARTAATGRVDAVLDTRSRMLRWRARFNALSGSPVAAHFHGPAAVGVNAPAVITWPQPLVASMEGRATLTPQQAADVQAGRWYASVHTDKFPAGEIRGQMTVRR
jgi:CHRD domain